MIKSVQDIKNARILISNDDGINSEGIIKLERIAKSLSKDVWIVAPESEQSASGHSLTLRSPLRIDRLEERFAMMEQADFDKISTSHLLLSSSGEKPQPRS